MTKKKAKVNIDSPEVENQEILTIDPGMDVANTQPVVDEIAEKASPDEPVSYQIEPPVQEPNIDSPEVETDDIITKTYQLIDAQKLSFSVSVGLSNVAITFNGGIRSEAITISGKYTTSNKDIQKALESDTYFNKKYTLVREQKQLPVKEDPHLSEKLENQTIVATVKTIQDARKYLLENFKSVAPGEINNKNAVISMATKLNVVFPKIQ